MTSITCRTNAIVATVLRFSILLVRDMSTYLRAHQHIAGVDASIEDVREGCRDELLWDRNNSVGENRLVARTLGCGTTLIDSAPVTRLHTSIDVSLDTSAKVKATSKEQRITEQPGEDKQEAKTAGGCGTWSATSPTTALISSNDIFLAPPVEVKPSLRTQKTMDEPNTGCRLHKTHTERNSGEELDAAPLSHRAARRARKARAVLAQSPIDSVVQAASPPPPLEDLPQKVANPVPCSSSRLTSMAIRPQQGSKMAGKATSKTALVSNLSMAEEASTSSELTKKIAKSGCDASEKVLAFPALGSDYSDTSVAAGPSNIKPAVSSKPGAETPPELESFYNKARRDQEWTWRLKQLKASLVGAKSAAEKEMVANAIFDLMDEAQAELGDDGAPICPRGLRWETDSTFEIQAPTREDKVVRKAIHATMKSKALKELGVREDYDFSDCAQQWWERHRPSTAVQKDLESSTIEALSLYEHHIRKLMQCRANLDLRRRAHSAASSRLGRASNTLQCLVRQGTYCTNFWQSQQNSAQRGVRQATKALREARASETRVVSTVSP